MKRWILPLFVLIGMGLPFQALAQGTMEGVVRDANTDEPVIGAQIVLPALNIGTVTDIDGTYQLTGIPAGSYDVEFRFIGYRTEAQTVTITSGQTATVNVALEETAINLDEVVVTGAGGAGRKTETRQLHRHD